MTTTPEQLLENFKSQQNQLMDEIRKLDAELAQKKELYVKLQGAIEGISILNPEAAKSLEKPPEAPEASDEAVAEAMS